MSNQENMTPPKETNKTLMSYPKEIEVCELCQITYNLLKGIQ